MDRLWSHRAHAARLRFIGYSRAIERHGHQSMTWKQGTSAAAALIQRGGASIKAIGPVFKGQDRADDFGSEIAELEDVVVQLAAMDDWSRRLRRYLRSLTDRGQRAFRRLVKRGCVPDDLVQCLECQADPEERQAEQRSRAERSAYRPRLQALAKSFEKLAKECDRYIALRVRYGGSTFPLDSNLSPFLRREAAAVAEFVRASDPRRRGQRTLADASLFHTMADIKAITGRFQDPLVADLLSSVRKAEETADNLKRWRAREAERWNAWKVPAYLARPGLRVSAEGSPVRQSRRQKHKRGRPKVLPRHLARLLGGLVREPLVDGSSDLLAHRDAVPVLDRPECRLLVRADPEGIGFFGPVRPLGGFGHMWLYVIMSI